MGRMVVPGATSMTQDHRSIGTIVMCAFVKRVSLFRPNDLEFSFLQCLVAKSDFVKTGFPFCSCGQTTTIIQSGFLPLLHEPKRFLQRTWTQKCNRSSACFGTLFSAHIARCTWCPKVSVRESVCTTINWLSEDTMNKQTHLELGVTLAYRNSCTHKTAQLALRKFIQTREGDGAFPLQLPNQFICLELDIFEFWTSYIVFAFCLHCCFHYR